jgi:hypothetical protein
MRLPDAVIEEHQLAGLLIDLGMGRELGGQCASEVLLADRLERHRVKRIRAAGSVPQREQAVAVEDHVGVGGVLLAAVGICGERL